MSQENFGEFLENVEEVNQAINLLMKGELSEEEYERLEWKVNHKKYEDMQKV